MLRKKLISSGMLYFILVAVVLPFYPAKVEAEEPLSISGLAVETKSFRPYREKGKFSFFLNRASQITAEIQDSDFNLVRTLALMKSGISGENELEWDGKDEDGKFIEDGKYIFSLSAITDDGSSALISKEMSFYFDAPEGTVFKKNITKVDGKEKKSHVHEAPERIKPGKYGSFPSCIFGIILFPAVLLELIYSPYKCEHMMLCYKKDYEELDEMNQEIDEYNAEIDAEIAEKNKEIDEFNERVKETTTIMMELVD